MSSSTPFQIIIVGGGIAGMSAAIALRGPGREIVVLEQSSLLNEIGAAVSLQPNASRILHRDWRIDSLGDAHGMIDQGFRIFNTEGEEIRHIPLTSKQEYDGDRIMYHRQDLHDCLRRAALDQQRPGKPVRLTTSARVVACDAEQGIVHLEDGQQLDADLVVAADGIHSTIRREVIGSAVEPLPTGLSAYRMVFPTLRLEETSPEFCKTLHVREPLTSMVVAHDCRLIMGPARNGELYSIVALVPDERMNEDANTKQSWTSEGDLNQMLQTFHEFPGWIKVVLRDAKDLRLWQLRDTEPLRTWIRGRVILIGDAAHAMLPTQGQGAGQAIEDAEALGAFFKDVRGRPSFEQIQHRLNEVFECRYRRATLVQQYSRRAAKPAEDSNGQGPTLRPEEFMDYNCMYRGGVRWLEQQRLDDMRTANALGKQNVGDAGPERGLPRHLVASST